MSRIGTDRAPRLSSLYSDNPMKKSLRIAVADDELDMREFFQRMLSRNGHQVVSVAENGRQLVEQCRELQPDLVITDIKMPDLDGI